jgi:histidinol-phosphatase (PHP family)
MKQDFDLHMHTTYCDGKYSAEEMVLAAIEHGLKTVGLSGHSFTWFDTSYCMSLEDTQAYIEEVNSLKEKYAGKIQVLLGTELDYWADIDTAPYDYLIGSSHYILKDGDYLDVDCKLEMTMDEANSHFGGDMAAMAAAYYEQVGSIVSKTGCDIIGHFDLITKFNEMLPVQIVGTSDPRYMTAWMDAVDRIFEETAELRRSGHPNRLETLGILKAGDKPVFEINTGAMAKGYRTSPYPAADQIRYIQNKGGILVLSSDSHSTDTICYAFDAIQL